MHVLPGAGDGKFHHQIAQRIKRLENDLAALETVLADVNADGQINAADLLLLQQLVLAAP